MVTGWMATLSTTIGLLGFAFAAISSAMATLLLFLARARSHFAAWLLTALLVPPLLARIRAEERLLRTQFGAEYDAYRSRTSRLIPGLY